MPLLQSAGACKPPLPCAACDLTEMVSCLSQSGPSMLTVHKQQTSDPSLCRSLPGFQLKQSLPCHPASVSTAVFIDESSCCNSFTQELQSDLLDSVCERMLGRRLEGILQQTLLMGRGASRLLWLKTGSACLQELGLPPPANNLLVGARDMLPDRLVAGAATELVNIEGVEVGRKSDDKAVANCPQEGGPAILPL